MTIRLSTERGALARLTATIGLGAAAAVHAAWASGSTWPTDGPDELADLVVGRPPFPSTRDTWVVAALLAGATVTVAAPPSKGRLGPWHRRARASLAAVLFARGAAGLVGSATGLFSTSAAFRRWNLGLYSPLCLVLSACVAASRPRAGVR